MADDADKTQAIVEDSVSKKIQEIINRPEYLGQPGDCELCGEWSGRLVEGVCAPCRDKHKLP